MLFAEYRVAMTTPAHARLFLSFCLCTLYDDGAAKRGQREDERGRSVPGWGLGMRADVRGEDLHALLAASRPASCARFLGAGRRSGRVRGGWLRSAQRTSAGIARTRATPSSPGDVCEGASSSSRAPAVVGGVGK
ncbi:hypothetical protein DFH09DRAFT_1354654 [Mycena vulgaris]|nr:hypothetical protein DFH09DRAFT_1354654 [Mycena vulgaris]